MSKPPVHTQSLAANFFPTHRQELLLKTALSDSREAIACWTAFREAWQIEEYLDNGSFRLLPLVYRRLCEIENDESRLPILKGIYKQTWYKNQSLLYGAQKIISLFTSAGIDTLVLKGISYLFLYYQDIGARPMSDIDLLVPEPKASEAINLLQQHGWKAEHQEYIAYNLKYGKSMLFTDESGFQLDLHWHPFVESNGMPQNAGFWYNAVELKLPEVKTLALCPEDNLLHTIVHGLKYNPEPPVRWIADAVTLLKGSSTLKWEYFIKTAGVYKLKLQVRDALEYLKSNFEANVPDEVLDHFVKLNPSKAEIMIYKYTMTHTDEMPLSFWSRLFYLYIGYLRQSEKRNPVIIGLGFLRYLRFRTKGKSYLKILYFYAFGSFHKQPVTK